MKIDGRKIAYGIKNSLKKQVNIILSQNISPHLAVIIVGKDKSSLAYVRQKQITGADIGVKVSVISFPDNLAQNKLFSEIDRLNQDRSVHGIIIQRPLPITVDNIKLDKAVTPQKDVDGFHKNSLFRPPIALAIMHILHNIFSTIKNDKNESFSGWLSKKKILVIGRGETGGKPIANYLMKNNLSITIAHSKTTDLKRACLTSEIIVSCVGKSNIVRHDMITNKTILIGVGLHPEDNKLRSDYDEAEIAQRAAFYTPVPGGVGPVNVACLFENLVKACKI
ncbi:bifunctional 5,10-methylenetetrahydrofolate dehydrogenase/5,10-methenyltetrahydrofolate cyclohydrolase [Patescibacteria group bacterium]|nr:bifunctional 5,10-methylenetetrahydrofolate dehydrogenase/5,10-methenyltetrahydrofolate cyclohydrolase [Patescibacteria group bacterium]MCL5797518.1 bifunctional 5,10-methylenetetrahydrofolate dehydrogenase/5,10-methenyltetrahydrofolate cyclohydrolase [Patescibacteria group bacterium]